MSRYWWVRSAPAASTAGMSERADDAVTAQPPLSPASLASDGATSGTAATYRLASAARSCPGSAFTSVAGTGLDVMKMTARRPERPHDRAGVAGQRLDEPGGPGAHYRRLGAVQQPDHQVGDGVLRALKL